MPEQLSAPVAEHRRYGRSASPAERARPPTSFSSEEMTAEQREESAREVQGETAKDTPTLQQQHRSSVVAAG